MLERRPYETGLQELAGEPVVLVEEIAMEGAELRGGHVDLPEHVLRLLDFLPEPHLAVFHAGRPFEVVHAVDALQGHGDALEPVSELRRDGSELDSAGLLEIRELGN